MKTIYIAGIMVALMTGSFATKAQTVTDTTKKITTHHHRKKKDLDYVYVKNNVLMLHQKGTETMMYRDFHCENHTDVTPDCKMLLYDGTSRKLNNGDRVYSDGSYKIGKVWKEPYLD